MLRFHVRYPSDLETKSKFLQAIKENIEVNVLKLWIVSDLMVQCYFTQHDSQSVQEFFRLTGCQSILKDMLAAEKLESQLFKAAIQWSILTKESYLSDLSDDQLSGLGDNDLIYWQKTAAF